MNKVTVGILAGVGGLVTGLLIARAVYQAKVSGAIGEGLGFFGLGGGRLQSIAEAVVLGN